MTTPNHEPRFTTRAELEALAREHGWSVQWGTADWSNVIRRVTQPDSDGGGA